MMTMKGLVKRGVSCGAAVLVIALWSCTVRSRPAPVVEPPAPVAEPPAPVVEQDDTVPGESFAIVAVKIFDGEAFRPDQDVWVEDGRIRAVGHALHLPDGLARVDGRGQTLTPGLIDSHVHTFGTTLKDAVRFGVTTVLDQFTDPTLAASKRAARAVLARGDEADLFSAGMLATAAGGHGTQFGVGMAVEPVPGPAEAGRWVRARKAEGSDWIKIVYEDGVTYGTSIPSLDRETIGALIAAAHAEGLLAVMHVSTLAHALEAVELGVDGLVHVWGDVVVDEEQVARIADAGVFVVPTLSVLTAIDLTAMNEDVGNRERAQAPGDARDRGTARGEVAIENVRRLHAAGVRLLAGTDAPNAGTGTGISLHGELQLLVCAGLSSAESLAAATSIPATSFGIEDRGRMEAGQLADLVLFNGDLELDVSASTRIAAIWKDGYRLERGLDEEISSAAPETALISDFEDGIGARFGAGWQVTTDRTRGGSSAANLSAPEGTLRVEGEVVSGDFPFPWSGAIYFPGRQPMQPVDFGGREVLRFRTRGDGRTYMVMLFDGSGAGVPPAVPFTAPVTWTEIEIPLTRFPSASPGLIAGLSFVASLTPGTYAFELDDVEIQ